MRSNRGAMPARRLAVLVIVALAPLWLVGILGRGLWTPDEPREADIAWRMSLQSERTLPQLAGTPFLEKPPLTYWMSAAALTLLGDSAAAARAPNLVYVLVTVLAVGALALAMDLELLPAVFAALVAGSALLCLRVGIWLAPDACLVAGNALALLGVWRGYHAPRRDGQSCAATHSCTSGLPSASWPRAPRDGWCRAWRSLALIAWERRWSELRRPELYAGLLLQALIIGPWVACVTATAQGDRGTAHALLEQHRRALRAGAGAGGPGLHQRAPQPGRQVPAGAAVLPAAVDAGGRRGAAQRVAAGTRAGGGRAAVALCAGRQRALPRHPFGRGNRTRRVRRPGAPGDRGARRTVAAAAARAAGYV